MSRLTTVNSNYFEASNLNGTVVLKCLFYHLDTNSTWILLEHLNILLFVQSGELFFA